MNIIKLLLLSISLLSTACSSTFINKKFFPTDHANAPVVFEPTVGPIVGTVTNKNFRVWIRGTKNAKGIIRYREKDEDDWSNGEIFSLTADADFTGTKLITLKKIKSKEIKYQIGYFHEKYTNTDLNWATNFPTYKVKLFPKNGSDDITRFILGSCRDQTKHSEKGEDTFSHINALLDKENENTADVNSQFIIQGGDQVYLDLDGDYIDIVNAVIAPINNFPQYSNIENLWNTYRNSFSQNQYKKTLTLLPTFMAIDDHEIFNDWTKGKVESGYKGLSTAQFNEIAKTYQAYQGVLNTGEQQINNTKFWYTFNHAKSDFFVLDTRSGNEMYDNVKHEPKVLDKIQMDALLCWLGIDKLKETICAKNKNDHIKFIVSPIPPFPDVISDGILTAKEPLDKWASGVKQRHSLFEAIRNNKIKRVVFLSGDVHASFIAELTYCDKSRSCTDDFKIYNISASPFNWSWTGGKGLTKDNFDMTEDKKSLKTCTLTNCKIGSECSKPSTNYFVRRYKTHPATPITHEKNNFTRITTNKNDFITVEYFSGHTGKLLESTNIYFN